MLTLASLLGLVKMRSHIIIKNKINPFNKTINVSGWNVGKVLNMDGMFKGNQLLTSLNIGTWNSNKVKADMKNATKLMELYKIDGVPQLIVNDTYLTSPGMVGGSHKRALKVVEYLLQKK